MAFRRLPSPTALQPTALIPRPQLLTADSLPPSFLPPHHSPLKIMASPPSLRLIYFNFGGRAEAIRLALFVGEVEFEDVRITEEEFRQRKAEGKYPFGSVPVLEVDGVVYAQSVGILRFVGRLGGLYPEEPLAGLAIDQIVGGVEDMIVATVPYLFAPETDKPLMKEKLEKDVYPRFFSAFEKLLHADGEGFFYGKHLTIADLAVYPVLQWITTSIVDKESLDPYPLLKALFATIEGHEKVKDYYEHERLRAEKEGEGAGEGRGEES